MGRVDGSAERILASRFSIRGYPSFFLLDGWDVYEYVGTRSKETLTDFAKRGYKKEQVRVNIKRNRGMNEICQVFD